jgi:hypothetical protein
MLLSGVLSRRVKGFEERDKITGRAVIAKDFFDENGGVVFRGGVQD